MTEDRQAALEQLIDELAEIYDDLNTLKTEEIACEDSNAWVVICTRSAAESVLAAINSLEGN